MTTPTGSRILLVKMHNGLDLRAGLLTGSLAQIQDQLRSHSIYIAKQVRSWQFSWQIGVSAGRSLESFLRSGTQGEDVVRWPESYRRFSPIG